MTLVELLVAFALFVIMMLGLIALASSSVEHWRRSETRKDSYDRGERILESLEHDLRNAYADAEVPRWNQRPLAPAPFVCDRTADGSQRLRFVRNAAEPPDPRARGNDAVLQMYGNLLEVAYVLDPGTQTLWRFERPFERGGRMSIFDASFARARPGQGAGWAPVEQGVLAVEYRFLAGAGAQTIDTWNSMQATRWQAFVDPDLAMPATVEVTADVEARTTDVAPVRLAAPLSPGAARIEATQTGPVPDPPAFVLVDAEWIEIDAKDATGLHVRSRGARGTRAAPHDAGAPVRLPRRFVSTVYVPVHRDPLRP